jgi:transposase
MIELEGIHEVFLCREATDMRKSIDGLSVVVQQEMGKNPFDRALFVFCNKKRDRLKVLYWNRTGFAVWFTRLEKERFFWPKKDENEVVEITRDQLRWLLEGYQHWRMKPHKKLKYERVS